MVPGKPWWLVRIVVGLLLVAGPAAAWVEKRVASTSVVVDVDRSGSALVSHEVLLVLRGGPLREFAMEPVDLDAEVVPGATATRAVSGQAAGYPVPLTVTREGPRLTLRAEVDKGLRSGTYQIRVAYRTQLLTSGRLVTSGPDATIEWRGPTFADGIDSARVVFRVPRAAKPPRLRTADGEPEATDIAADASGVFLGTLRRSGESDEIEVVRPHVAKSEAVTWRVVADSTAFESTPAASPREAVAAPAPLPRSTALPRVSLSAQTFAFALLAGLVYGLLVALKNRSVVQALAERGAVARPLVPLPSWLRATASVLAVTAAVTVVLLSMPPLVGALMILLGIAMATHLPPRVPAPLRGPGKWVRLDVEALLEALPRASGSARFLDSGHPLGFVLFLSGLMGFVAGAVTLFPRSPYLACALALSASLLFPIFFTGRAAEVHLGPAQAPLPLLEWLHVRLEKGGIAAHPIGRLPDGAAAPDEVRLLVTPQRPAPGLVAIEVGTDLGVGVLGALSQPFVIVRVAEGSDAPASLPKGLFWSRGRSADERVAVLRPRLPTARVTCELVRDLVGRLSVSEEPRRPAGPVVASQSEKSAARSRGRGDSTRKEGTTASPAHAT